MQRSLPTAASSGLLFEHDEDQAPKCCEDIIATRTVDSSREAGLRSWLLRRSARGMERFFDRQTAFESFLQELEPWLAIRMHSADEDMAASREGPVCLRFLQSGYVSVYDEVGANLPAGSRRFTKLHEAERVPHVYRSLIHPRQRNSAVFRELIEHRMFDSSPVDGRGVFWRAGSKVVCALVLWRPWNA